MRRVLTLLAVLSCTSSAAAEDTLYYFARLYSVCDSSPTTVWSDALEWGQITIGDASVSLTTATPAVDVSVPGFRVPKWRCIGNSVDCNRRNLKILDRSHFVGMTDTPIPIPDFVFVGDADVEALVSADIEFTLDESTNEIVKGRGKLQLEVPDWLSFGRCRAWGPIKVRRRSFN